MKKQLRGVLIKNTYIIICKIYQILTTFIEFLIFKKYKSKSLKLGYTRYLSNFHNFSVLYNNDPIKVNQYLSVRKLKKNDLKIIIKSVFTDDFTKYLTNQTGFEYSIDFFIAYERKYIKHSDRNVSTLDQWYSYKWHFDKPNSSNMLKIIIPINIETNEGGLECINKQESKKIKDFSRLNLDSQKIKIFKGQGQYFYAFNPRLCIHRDGIPSKDKIATQIMFQLNPWKRWSINKRIFKNQISLNKELGIWTSEPKFTQIYNINANREFL